MNQEERVIYIVRNDQMNQGKFTIHNIPAVLYGEPSEKVYLFLHGKCGYKEEGEAFAQLVSENNWQVLSIDLPEHGERKSETERFNPWCIVPELKSVLEYVHGHWKRVALRANSIGAWFAMQSFSGSEFEQSLFVSPILDMKKLIQEMMTWAKVSEERLEKEQVIETNFGETLSWQYYTYAKEHSISMWNCNTNILYAGNDNLTSKETVEEFVQKFHARLTVMEEGEHWFHTKEQLEVLNDWTRKCMEM